MRWFEGDISSAVAKSKSEKAVFVVFVEGKDNATQDFVKALDSTDVCSRLESDKFVAIKVESESNTFTFFAEIYKQVPVPSIFFIGENGRPLEIVVNISSSADLVSKIDSVLEKINGQAKSSVNLVNTEKAEHSTSSNENNTINETKSVNPLTSDETTASLSPCNAEPSTEAADENVLDKNKELARAKLLIEMQNKKKAEEEERKEREREIERRKMGRDVQKWRKEQHDRQIKEAHEERMKEKAADAAAREKILRQINEDKLERKRKYEASVQEKNVIKQNKAQEEAARVQAALANSMSKARIQFKFPAGNILTGNFEASDLLGTLRAYVIQNAELPFQQFSMSAFFPRRDFTTDDDNKTLLELELVPSSVILILPNKNKSPGTIKKSDDGGNIFSFFFWTLLAPVISIYNYVMGYFRGRPDGGGNGNDNESRNTGSTQIGNLNIDLSRLTNLRNRLGAQRTAKIKSTGNIHTLNSEDNDNDENNTWNGNSTQQM